MKKLIKKERLHSAILGLGTKTIGEDNLGPICQHVGYKYEQGNKPIVPLCQEQISDNGMNKAMQKQERKTRNTPTILSFVDTIKLEKEIGNKVCRKKTEKQVYHDNKEVTIFSNRTKNWSIKGTLAV